MSRIILYYHGGSKNHGCEAIVRSTSKILSQKDNKKDIFLFSSSPEEDYKYKLDDVVNILQDLPQPIKKDNIKYYIAAIHRKISKNDYKHIVFSHEEFFNFIKTNDICFSIGGDNYCYKGQDILGYYNKHIHKKGAKTVLWGCSVEPELLNDEIKEDLSHYDLIVARESISYHLLKEINSNTVLLPDPAFQLDKELLDLPDKFIPNKTVGVNLSPLISEYGNDKLIFNNYVNLVKYILDNTDFQVALIPHVIKNNNDDREILNKLYSSLDNSNRILKIEDCNCMQIKGFISRCRLFIGARTHATIAAYSTCVPTLVVGYSVKARGIAKDIFGTEDNYVLPVQNLKTENDIANAFCWLLEHEGSIRTHLEEFIPTYKERILKVNELIDRL